CTRRNVIVRSLGRGFVEERRLDVAGVYYAIEQHEVMPHGKLRCGPDILDGDGDFLAWRRVKRGHVITHFVVRLDGYLFRRPLRRMRATGEEPEKRVATKGHRRD